MLDGSAQGLTALLKIFGLGVFILFMYVLFGSDFSQLSNQSLIPMLESLASILITGLLTTVKWAGFVGIVICALATSVLMVLHKIEIKREKGFLDRDYSQTIVDFVTDYNKYLSQEGLQTYPSVEIVTDSPVSLRNIYLYTLNSYQTTYQLFMEQDSRELSDKVNETSVIELLKLFKELQNEYSKNKTNIEFLKAQGVLNSLLNNNITSKQSLKNLTKHKIDSRTGITMGYDSPIQTYLENLNRLKKDLYSATKF